MNEEPKISKNREKKVGIVSSLSEKYTKAKAVIFTNYQGLTHKQIEGLKKQLKKADSEFVVAKNSLLTRAITDKKLEGEHELGGQTGTLFLYNDLLLPLKELAKLIKELNLPNVKFGIMEGDFVTGEQILKLSTLPTREVLLSQLVFTLKSPISGLHKALNWNLQKLVMTLNAVVQNKPADSVPTSPANKQPVIEQTEAVQEQASVQTPVAESLNSESAKPPSGEPVEPETILSETPQELAAEKPENQSNNENKGGEN
ncbi:MAG: 50S ribosomal protein L10 [Candidatus Levybacteria bacterium RIFCSPLOWO2_01_FULL_36_13]|nr:MAG: 50S ribosomal protein L10 [Candidatus Levybacteria bacterium RIFCSPHIGHO2_01_FULL_36_15b]OGH35151.1 MAG: 50S ribosomal protein L10 [Candidatus Levybacteria bacterium RIFCSPLOWO2_01_FULL_36_13]